MIFLLFVFVLYLCVRVFVCVWFCVCFVVFVWQQKKIKWLLFLTIIIFNHAKSTSVTLFFKILRILSLFWVSWDYRTLGFETCDSYVLFIAFFSSYYHFVVCVCVCEYFCAMRGFCVIFFVKQNKETEKNNKSQPICFVF